MTLRLEDLELIKRLKYAYCRCIDTAGIDELRDLLTEDVSVCYVGGSYRFECAGREAVLEALASAFHSQAIALHHVNHPEIDFISDNEATGTWYLKDWFLDLKHRIITDGSALYRDTYVREGGRWKIKRASYERIFEIVTPFEQAPNITAHWLAQHGRVLP
jgi:hypothetical protein